MEDLHCSKSPTSEVDRQFNQLSKNTQLARESLSGNTALSVGHSHFIVFSFVLPKSNFTEANEKQSGNKSATSPHVWKLLFLVCAACQGHSGETSGKDAT